MSPSSFPRVLATRLPMVLALLLLSAAPAQAAITCTASITSLNFGTVDPLANQTTATATLSYRCTNGGNGMDSARVCFSFGAPEPRVMSSGPHQLPFQIYKDSARTQAWGSQNANASLNVVVSVHRDTPVSGSVSLYGQLGSAATAVPGNYTYQTSSAHLTMTLNERSGNNNDPGSCSNTLATGAPVLQVSAVIEKRCQIAAGTVPDIDLGTVAANATNISGNGSIGILCGQNTPYTVGLLPSNGHTGGAGLMSGTGGNTDKVPYQLYQNAGYSTPWGNTATASSAGNGIAGTGTGAVQSHTVYMRAPSADYRPDSYSDTVTVNVNY